MKALLKTKARALILLFVLGLLANLSSLSYPIVLKYLFDSVASTLQWNSVSGVLGIIALLAVGGALTSIARDYCSIRVATYFDSEISSQILSRIIQIPFHDLKKQPSGKWLVGMSQVQELKMALGNIGTQTFFDLFLVLGYTGLLFFYDPYAALSYIVLAILTLAASLWLGHSLYLKIKEGYQKKTRAESLFLEAIRNPILVRTFSLDHWVQNRWGGAYQSALQSFRKADVFGAIMLALFSFVRQAVPLLVLVWKLPSVSSGVITFGTALALTTVFTQGFEPFFKVSMLLSHIQKIRLSYEHLSEILALKEEPSGQSDKLNNLDAGPVSVRFENVSFAFTDTGTILKEINLEAKAGERIALVGPSGAGKTTLFHLLLRLYENQSGQLLLNNQHVQNISLGTLRKWIGFVSNSSEMFSGTLIENIALGDSNPDFSRVVECARLVNAESFILSLPDGFHTKVGEGQHSFSAGQTQRISLARALYRNPRLLLLDEPTSALDAVTEREITQALIHMDRKRTLIVSAHRLETVINFDKIYVMEDGRIAEKGTHEELISQPGIYSRLWEARSKGERAPFAIQRSPSHEFHYTT